MGRDIRQQDIVDLKSAEKSLRYTYQSDRVDQTNDVFISDILFSSFREDDRLIECYLKFSEHYNAWMKFALEKNIKNRGTITCAVILIRIL